MKTRILLGGIVIFATASFCQAGWLGDTIEGVGKRLGNRAVNDVGNSTYDATKGGLKDAVKGDKEQSSGSKQPAQKTYDQKEVKGGASAASGDNLSIEDAETVYTKFDFIPGDKMIFFDDFSDTDVGEFPRKWHLNGPKPGNNGAVEVVEYQGRRFLRSNPANKGQEQYPSVQYIRLNQKGDMPEKFTVEFDALLSNALKSNAKFPNRYFLFLLGDKQGWPGTGAGHGKQAGKIQFSGEDNISLNTSTKLNVQDEKIHHISVTINGTFVKAYVDGTRVINDPDGVKRPIRQIGIGMANIAGYQTDRMMFTNFRLAEGGKKIKSALDTDGKIITHGILFDTGKATLKAESLPTLKMILGLLNDDPELKFSIEGHTDNQGSKGINHPLSERRAAAVKAWLEEKGIDSGRLKNVGYGDAKPIDSNKTLEGRANNRRVEFVKF
ncbi:MAG: OmpA family protein [Desulfuromonadaceae bacterium]|nr:OmpA family protein [Desulfuromonadaceae bacterium]